MHYLNEKKSTRKFNVGAQVCTERDKEIKKRSDLLGKKQIVPTGHDLIQLSFHNVKENGIRNFLL